MKNIILASILSTVLSGCVTTTTTIKDLNGNPWKPQEPISNDDLLNNSFFSGSSIHDRAIKSDVVNRMNIFSSDRMDTILTPSDSIWNLNKIKKKDPPGVINIGTRSSDSGDIDLTTIPVELISPVQPYAKVNQTLVRTNPATGIFLQKNQNLTVENVILGLLSAQGNNIITILQDSHVDYLSCSSDVTLTVDNGNLKITAGLIRRSAIKSQNGGSIEVINLDSSILTKSLKTSVLNIISSEIGPDFTISESSSVKTLGATFEGSVINNGEFTLNKGTIKGSVKNGDGARFYINGGVMEQTFENSGGAVYFDGTKNAEIKGRFSSIGQSARNAHHNSTVRLTMGPHTLTTGPIQFDDKTKLFLTLNNSGPTIPLVKSTGSIDLANATFELSTAKLKETVKKDKYILFQAASGISHLNKVLKGEKTDKCKVTLEGDKVMLELLESIARPLDSRKKRHTHSGLFKSHGHQNDYARTHISSLQTGIAFDAKANQTTLTNGLSLTTSENSEKSYQFMAMDQKIGSESFGVYAGYAAEKNTIRDFGAYQMSSFGLLNITYHFGFSGNADEKFEDGVQFNADSKSLFATSQISLPVSFGNFTFSPKAGLGYNKLLDAKNSFTEEGEIFNVSSNSTGSFEGVIGLDITSKFNFNGIALASFASLNFTSELGSQNITITGNDEISNYTDSYSFVDFKAGINATLDAHSKMYATFKISSEKNDTDSKKDFEVGMNFKI